MQSIAEIANTIIALPERNRSGTLRMFGEWFGRPMDNLHRVTAATAEGGCLVLSFDNGETLTIWNPAGYTSENYTIRFADADRVRWEWYFYGRDQTKENLCVLDYRKEHGQIITSRSDKSDISQASPQEPAVELIGR